MISPLVAWLRMSRPLISLRMGVRAWVQPMPIPKTLDLFRKVMYYVDVTLHDRRPGGVRQDPGGPHRVVWTDPAVLQS
jgi:hypothetical protein